MRPNPLIPHHLANDDPSYLVWGGIVFTVASEPYLASEYGQDYAQDAPVKLLDRLLHGYKHTDDEEVRSHFVQVMCHTGERETARESSHTHSLLVSCVQCVIINQVLACHATVGYEVSRMT